jgi:transcriptional regulator with XRE-family HTH domain
MAATHIGEQIKEVLEKKGLSVTEFSKRINKSRENCYSIFGRKTIDTGLLQQISAVLEYDFFEQFSFKGKQLSEEISRLTDEITLLKDYTNLLKNSRREE